MRVLFIGRSHQFSLLPLSVLAADNQIVAIVESAPRGARSRTQKLRRRLHEVRARQSNPDSLPYQARLYEVPYFWLDKTARPRLLPLIRSVRPEVICVASLSYLLPADILKSTTFGVINLHPSLLPRYHGPFPWFWQYHDFRLNIGVTVHQVDEGQDTGPILAQTPLRLELGTDIQDAMLQAGSLGATLMRSVVRSLEDDTVVRRPQRHGSLPKARTVARTERFIDWQSWPLERVWHFMRGTYPWVDHFDRPSEFGDCTYRVGPMHRESAGLAPGSVGRDEVGWFVVHREGTIRVLPVPRP